MREVAGDWTAAAAAAAAAAARRDRPNEWWRKVVVVPARRAWVVVAARLRRKKHDGRGVLVKLRDDIQTCAYEDVQVMWEMLQRSETEKMAGAPPTPKAAGAFVWLGSRRRHHAMDLLRPRC